MVKRLKSWINRRLSKNRLAISISGLMPDFTGECTFFDKKASNCCVEKIWTKLSR